MPVTIDVLTGIVIVLCAPIVISAISKFVPVTSNISPVFATMRNWPLMSAATPVRVPLILTDAPGTGSPFSSVTVPVIVRSWPNANAEINISTAISDAIFLMRIKFMVYN